MRRFGAAIVCLLSLTPTCWSAEKRVVFNRDVRPILSNNCYLCHGPDAKNRQAGLRLDVREDAVKPLESGQTAIVPGEALKSHLLARITTTNPGEVMPPPATGKTLTAAEIATLTDWINEGAEYQGHWSFLTPQRPQPPEVSSNDFLHNEIDAFVLAKLQAEGLAPSPAADKVTLIRRVTLDLTGLPPTPEEVDAFVNDASPGAYGALVDRLLQSPRYGEHFGRIWLDAARYGDTHGLHLDNERSLWPYREWVINAFNQNKPFDQFTIEQLAGDLLPNPTREQLIATGFNRCNVTTSEGGSINEEVLVRYAVDRVETMSTVWLGLTMGCAVCHNHKFDPISQAEFYQLYAFFNSLSDQAMDGNALLPPPTMKLPTPEQTTQLAEFDQRIGALQQTIQAELAKVDYRDSESDEPADAFAFVPRDYVWIDDGLPAGGQSAGAEWKFVATAEGPVYRGDKSSVLKATELTQLVMQNAAPTLKIGAGDKLFAYVYLDPANPPQEIMLQFNDGAWEHRAYWGDDKIPWGLANTPAHVHMGPLPEAGKWIRLEVDAARVNLFPGAELNGWAFTQFQGTCHWDAAGIVTRTPQADVGFTSQIAWEQHERGVQKSAVPANIQQLIKIEPAQRNADQQAQLKNYFLEHVYDLTKAVFQPLHQELNDLNQRRTALDGAIPSTMITADLTQPREAFVLVRGAYDKPGEKVSRGVPSVFPPLPSNEPVNRLGLAKWLTAANHPLVSRVIVNRFWQHYFGTGIVKTSEDFGSQGQWPTHPELLDWLATEFQQTGWDVKRLQKQIVMSGTYRQSSKVTPELLQRDPENRLLARGPRFRLDAETIRDSVLFTSGLLVEKFGGKSVKPTQPEGVWEAVAFVGSNTREFRQDQGDALYRRSLYTFWKRTSPPPVMLTFDAPSRENCTVRRARTNTPLQALALMNDKQSVEASRQLAGRMLSHGETTDADRLAYGFRLVTARAPAPAETQVLLTVLQKQRARYLADLPAAEKLLAYGDSPRTSAVDPAEHAAWTMTANLLLNLDEAITKE
ncbi:MAG: PSD1 and planctomycete cytochrome C domain-containing protein [Planctomycetaceae bacterium]